MNNRIFMLARQGKWLPTWYIAIIGSFVITIGSGLALQFIFSQQPLATLVPINSLIKSKDVYLSALGQLLNFVITYSTRILLLMVWIKVLEKRPFWTVGLERQAALIKYLRGALLGIFMYGLAVSILALTGCVIIVGGSIDQIGWGALLGIIIILPGWLIQGASEDLVTRGWLLPTMGARYRPWIGVIISALMFTLFHLPALLASGFNILALISGLTVSLFLAAYVLYEGGVWGVIGWHAAWNLAEGNLLASQVSGHDIAGGSLVKLVSVGPTWLTGGTFGPEAGAVVIAIVALGLLIIIALAHRRAAISNENEAAQLLASSSN
ncbi:CPBP family intramembrane glutamic endopeptidase [Ktedonosporobacter rubrisoli]|uniref:CPBP family intramembrane glutamic endopeptidase n=1 Tax=Ktedonosporobacter rubrisoli TaxID=2509675 RepID=UPI0013EEE358|nr:type II CAAX endopeptidase family protein [Ktedonosporobacter rubrisoli]